MNSVCITGRLVETPALSTTKTGKSVSTFSVAVRRDRERADFFRCVAWNGTAEHVCKWFRKGQEIAIEGRLQTQSWTDKHGQKRTDVEIVVEEAGFCGRVNPANSEFGMRNSELTQTDRCDQEEGAMLWDGVEFEEVDAD